MCACQVAFVFNRSEISYDILQITDRGPQKTLTMNRVKVEARSLTPLAGIKRMFPNKKSPFY